MRWSVANAFGLAAWLCGVAFAQDAEVCVDAQGGRFPPVNGECRCPHGAARAQTPGSPVHVCPPAPPPTRAPSPAVTPAGGGVPRQATPPPTQRRPRTPTAAERIAAEREALEAQRQAEQTAREAEERAEAAQQQRAAEEERERVAAERQRLQTEREAQERLAAERVRVEAEQRRALAPTMAGTPRIHAQREGCQPGQLSRPFVVGEEVREVAACEPLPTVSATTGPAPRTAQRVVGWALVGVGAALGAAGAVFWGLSYDTAQRLEGYCDHAGYRTDPACNASESGAQARADGVPVAAAATLCASQRSEALDGLCSRNGFQGYTAWALGAAGAAALVTGVVLVATSPRSRTITPTAWVRTDGGGLLLRGSF